MERPQWGRSVAIRVYCESCQWNDILGSLCDKLKRGICKTGVQCNDIRLYVPGQDMSCRWLELLRCIPKTKWWSCYHCLWPELKYYRSPMFWRLIYSLGTTGMKTRRTQTKGSSRLSYCRTCLMCHANIYIYMYYFRSIYALAFYRLSLSNCPLLSLFRADSVVLRFSTVRFSSTCYMLAVRI